MNTLTQAERERLTNYVNSAHTKVLQIIKPLSDQGLGFLIANSSKPLPVRSTGIHSRCILAPSEL